MEEVKKKCPYCGEEIMAVAKKCKHCGEWLDESKATNALQMSQKEEISVTVFLVNGVKLQGIITFFDNETLLLRRDGHTQLIYKHAVSTIMPGEAVEL